MIPRERREQLLAFGRRGQQVLFLAAATGIATGLVVSAFEYLVFEVVYEELFTASIGVRAAAPVVGLVLAALTLRYLGGGTSPITTDDYISRYHAKSRPAPARTVAARMIASAATLGTGVSLGFEGPSIQAGSSIGAVIQARLSRFFSRADVNVLLVAGAAAGVSAIFRAPATGVVFALEVPYRDDLARRMLLPASIAAAASYLTFVALLGTEPLLPVRGDPEFALSELFASLALGVLCGVGARLFSVGIARAKHIADDRDPVKAALVAGALLAVFAVASEVIYDQPLTLGPGYDNIEWALDPTRSLGLVAGLFVFRAAVTLASVGGRGVGGLFIPLVILGALLGRFVGGAFDEANLTLFPLIGIAAFLGAGYRVPLAAVMFVAESTGRPGFVVPGLIAAVTAQLFMGRWSLSSEQVGSRLGHLERRFSLPIASAMRTDVLTVPPDATLQEFFWNHMIGARQRSSPVVDGAMHLGTIRMDELGEVKREDWGEVRVTELMRSDLPRARPDWTLRQAVHAMDTSDVDRLSVVDDQGLFIGVVTLEEIVKLDDILDATDD